MVPEAHFCGESPAQVGAKHIFSLGKLKLGIRSSHQLLYVLNLGHIEWYLLAMYTDYPTCQRSLHQEPPPPTFLDTR